MSSRTTGKVESLSESVNSTESSAPSPSLSGDGGTPSSYTPAVGDVVEFEQYYDRYENEKGIVFIHESRGFSLAMEHGEWQDFTGAMWDKMIGLKVVAKTSKVGRTPLTLDEARAIAKAYFAEQDKKPHYKVGDLVEVVDEQAFLRRGQAGLVIGLNDQVAELRFKDGTERFYVRYALRPLQGTYAERQAKWCDFYDIKAGSKVRVTTGIDGNEDRWPNSWNTTMNQAVGCEWEVVSISPETLFLSFKGGSFTFPYFALEPVS